MLKDVDERRAPVEEASESGPKPSATSGVGPKSNRSPSAAALPLVAFVVACWLEVIATTESGIKDPLAAEFDDFFKTEIEKISSRKRVSFEGDEQSTATRKSADLSTNATNHPPRIPPSERSQLALKFLQHFSKYGFIPNLVANSFHTTISHFFAQIGVMGVRETLRYLLGGLEEDFSSGSIHMGGLKQGLDLGGMGGERGKRFGFQKGGRAPRGKGFRDMSILEKDLVRIE